MPSISIAKGRGSLNHNKRKYYTPNVDQQRTVLNRVLVDLELQSVYHELFDEAVDRYNSKQKRADRRIDNYLQHVRKDKKTKEFHELVVQIGNKDDMQRLDPNELANLLEEYLTEFQERNQQLRVFSAIIHMDEATPHLHLDYVPYITGQKRGLDTRVSNDKALKQMGFSDWKEWRTAEMDALADILQRHSLKRTIMHDDASHLPVADYKRLQRDVDRRTIRLMKENQELKDKNLKLNQQLNMVSSPSTEIQFLKDTNEQLQNENKKLKTELAWYKKWSQTLIECIQAIVNVVVNCFDISYKELDDELTDYDVDASQTMTDVLDEQSLEKSRIK